MDHAYDGATAESDFKCRFVGVARIAAFRPNARKMPSFAEIEACWLALGNTLGGRVVDDIFHETLTRAWEQGWQPAEVARAVRRRRRPLHVELVTTAIASDHARRPNCPISEWSAQLLELGAHEVWWTSGRDWLSPWAGRAGSEPLDALATAAEALGVILWLPPVTQVLPPPSRWGSAGRTQALGPVDQTLLAKVRALLAKAESTSFAAEAEAFTAKAQQLMARYAIDEAMARSDLAGDQARPAGRRWGSTGTGPVARRVAVDDPYSRPKSILLGELAAANSVNSVWTPGLATMTLVGFGTDIETVQVLFTSLLMQASRSLLAAGQIRDERGRSRTRSFRQSFYLAFAYRIGERLREAAEQARIEARQEFGDERLLPVLAARHEEVQELTSELFPQLRSGRHPSITNRHGWAAGRAAADRASLSTARATLSQSA